MKAVVQAVALVSIWILCFSMIAGAAVPGGHDRGNGGDAIVCPSQTSRTRVLFFDVYEAENRFHMKPIFPEQEGLDQKVYALIQRLDKLNPTRAKLYRSWYSSFWQEANLLSGVELTDVPDTGMGFFPRGCRLEQLVVQQEPHFPTESRYTFNKDLWDLMDDNHRAVTVMHELILREARLPENDHETSEQSRYLDALILSGRVEAMTLQSFVEMLGILHFAQADANGFSIVVSNPSVVSFFGPSQLKAAPLHDRLRITVQGRVFEREVSAGRDGKNDAGVVFFENGQLAAVSITSMRELTTFPVHIDQNGLRGVLPARYVRFDSSGRVVDIRGVQSTEPSFVESPMMQIHFDKLEHYEMKFLATNEISIYGLQCSAAKILIGDQWHRVDNDVLLGADGSPHKYNLCQAMIEN